MPGNGKARHDSTAFSMRSTLEQVLKEATYHRLHPAMLLVAKERINPHQALALQWRFVDLQYARIGYPVYASIGDRINEARGARCCTVAVNRPSQSTASPKHAAKSRVNSDIL